MSDKQETWYDRVYAAKTVEETEEAYQGWAASYDADLYCAGYRGPAMVAALLCRYAKPGEAPILDAATGTGLAGELLGPLGYKNLVGIDLSDGMLAVAGSKNLYADLRRMRLGGPLDFPDDHFAATLVVGAFAPGHAEPQSMPELVRVTRPDAPVIFTVRVDGEVAAPFIRMQDTLEKQGLWSKVEVTAPMNILPVSEPDIYHRLFVYRVS